ncbi:hypothetical protein PanWU01x14_331700, partial [Parasponia andersonii]
IAMEKGSAHSGRPHALFTRENHVNAYIIRSLNSETGQVFSHMEKGLPTVADPTFYLHKQKGHPRLPRKRVRPQWLIQRFILHRQKIIPNYHGKGSATVTDYMHYSRNKRSYYESHVTHQRPEKTYEEETAVQQELASIPQKRSHYGSHITRR